MQLSTLIKKKTMGDYLLPHFGKIDPKNLEDYYDVEIDFDGNKIQIDLNFEEDSISTKRLDTVKKFIENIAAFDKKNRKYIEKDYEDEDSDTVRTYVDHHLAEIEKDDLSGMLISTINRQARNGR